MTEDEIPDTSLAQTLVTLHALRWLVFACIGAGSCVKLASLFAPGAVGSLFLVAESVVLIPLAYAAHRTYLTNGRLSLPSPDTLLSEPTFRLFFMLELFLATIQALISALSVQPGIPGILPFGIGVAMILGLARYGTVLPAAAVGGITGLEDASLRHSLWGLLWRLVAAQFLIIFILSAFVLLPGSAVELGFGIGSATGLALMIPLEIAIQAFGTVLIAIVLSRAYQGRYA